MSGFSAWKAELGGELFTFQRGYPALAGRNAAALIDPPRLLVLDEPLVGMDPRGALHRRIARLWATGMRLAPLRIPRGLRKFRSIEEANREREEWITDRVRALAASRSAQ